MAPTHVLVPLDGSPLATKGLRHALETYDCEVTVLNVLTPIGSTMSEGGIRDHTEQRVAEAEERTAKLITNARERTGADEQYVETVIEAGDPAEVIVGYVEESTVDHVVMGGGSRG